MFDLNGEEFKSQSSLIFNNGVAGKVDNVTMTVERKGPESTGNVPEYKVIFTDDAGASINMGIYYPTPKELYDDAKNASLAKLTVGKVLSVAKSALGNDYVFPAVNSAKEAIDTLMGLTGGKNGAKVNIFATYGTVSKPNKYLGVYKNFDFIESADANPSRLRVTKKGNQYDDLMERIVEDAPLQVEGQPVKQSWI